MSVDLELKYKLVGILEKLDPETWPRLERLLAEGEGVRMHSALDLPPMSEAAAREVMESAVDEVNHWKVLLLERTALHAQIEGALSYVRSALAQIKNLDALGDPEYMDGHADLEFHLEDVARVLRAAQSIKPTGKNGEAG